MTVNDASAEAAPGRQTSIGFVGLGNMGAVMSARLVAAGFTVHGHDISSSARAALADAGGLAHDNLGDAVRDASLVILMLPSSDAVRGSGPRPAVHARGGHDCHRHGLVRTGQNAGAGGRARPTRDHAGRREPIGNPILVGNVGAGHAVKALNNLLSATHLLSTAEAMAAGQRFGLDPGIMIDVFNRSSGQSRSTSSKWPDFVLPGTFNSGFTLALMVKDMRIALGLAEQVGAADRLSRSSLEIWAAAAESLPPTADQTELARWVLGMSGPGDDHTGG